jgi:leader peptidase (prepilin peptidase)/N-methyltransferase
MDARTERSASRRLTISPVASWASCAHPPRRRLLWQLPATGVLALISLVATGLLGAMGMLGATGMLGTGTRSPLAIVPLLCLAAVTPELARIDVREHRLPNRLVVPALAIGLLASGAQWAATGAFPVWPLVAGGAYAAFLLVLCALGGMGMGDVKLGAALGLAAWSPSVGVLSPVIAFLLGGGVSVVLLARRGRGGRIAFGPYLLAGFWAAVLLVALSRIP